MAYLIASVSRYRSDLQIGLVRGCWSELFSLGMAQCSQLMSLPDILSAIITALKTSVAQDKVSAQRVKLVRTNFPLSSGRRLSTFLLTFLLTFFFFYVSFDVFASFQVTEHVLQLQDYVNTMAKLQVDEQEYAYLKTIALFSPGTSILAPL